MPRIYADRRGFISLIRENPRQSAANQEEDVTTNPATNSALITRGHRNLVVAQQP